MHLKTIIAAFALALTTIGATRVQAQDPGPRLPATAIDASGAEVLLNLEDYRNIIGYRVYGKAELTDPEWTLLTDTHLTSPMLRDEPGASVHDFTALPTASVLKVTGFKFFKIHGVRKEVTFDKVVQTIRINLNDFSVTKLPGDFEVSSDPLAKTEHLYLRYIKPDGDTFTMGSPEEEYGRSADRETQTVVTLTQGFYLGVYAVTEAQYDRIMGVPTPSDSAKPKTPISWNSIRGGSGASPLTAPTLGSPLGTLSNKVSTASGGSIALTFDLPTEAQWEYACRAGTTGTLYDGNDIITTEEDNIARVEPLAWVISNSGGVFHDAGLKRANPAGLYDLFGNAWEWCRDANGSASAGDNLDLPGGSEVDYFKTDGTTRVLRGGSIFATWCRTARRISYGGGASNPDDINPLGFRLGAFGDMVP